MWSVSFSKSALYSKYVTSADKEFWYSLDKHLPMEQFEIKVRDKMGYKDCGGFTIDILGYEQPMEMFLSKDIKKE